jgi:hypothetical protein
MDGGSLQAVDLSGGSWNVLRSRKTPVDEFGEGITLFDGTLSDACMRLILDCWLVCLIV